MRIYCVFCEGDEPELICAFTTKEEAQKFCESQTLSKLFVGSYEWDLYQTAEEAIEEEGE